MAEGVVIMMSRRWRDDEELMADVAEASRYSIRVPEQMLSAARAAFASRAKDRNWVLAALSYDSVLDESLALRGSEQDGRRVITFDAGPVSVEIELAGDRMVGQLVPPMYGDVEMMTADGVAGRVATDSVGCFVLSRPAAGPVRFRCQIETGVVLTDWVLL
jgi:hypothetical protein